MSATSELITEQLQELETKLAEARKEGNAAEISRLVVEVDRVKAVFKSTTSSLREGRQLLKG